MKWQRVGRRWRYEYCRRMPGGYELIIHRACNINPRLGIFAVTVRLWDTADRLIFETTAQRYYETLILAKAAAVRLWKRTAKEQAK